MTSTVWNKTLTQQEITQSSLKMVILTVKFVIVYIDQVKSVSFHKINCKLNIDLQRFNVRGKSRLQQEHARSDTGMYRTNSWLVEKQRQAWAPGQVYELQYPTQLCLVILGLEIFLRGGGCRGHLRDQKKQSFNIHY